MDSFNSSVPIKLAIEAQPDDCSCGPTSLKAVYEYFGYSLSLEKIQEELNILEDGGTFGVSLGSHALAHGFKSELISFNLKMFDPSWSKLNSLELVSKLELQAKAKAKGSRKFQYASSCYIDYLKQGGKIIFNDLTFNLLDKYFDRGYPILAGLSSTYLYGSMRERVLSSEKLIDDDIKGEPTGHFVVLCGRKDDQVFVADPYRQNPLASDNYYKVEVQHLFHAILLGIITYDANILVIMPAKDSDYSLENSEEKVIP